VMRYMRHSKKTTVQGAVKRRRVMSALLLSLRPRTWFRR
jgi:hypothetical protein